MKKGKGFILIFILLFTLLVTTSCSRINLLINWKISIDSPTNIRYIIDEVDNIEAYQVWEYGNSSIKFLDKMTEITDANMEKAETYFDSLLATLPYYPSKVNIISQIADSAQLISNGNYIYYDTKHESTVLLLIFNTKNGEMYCFSSE